MDSEEKKDLKARLEDIKNSAKQQDLGEDPQSLLMGPQDFPDINKLENPELQKYKQELEESQLHAEEVITNLAALWLDGDENVLNQPYIKNRIKRDAKNQGSLDFLSSVSQQVLLKQLELLSNGDQSPRHFEIIYKGMSELEKINKSASNSLSVMENFYRRLRFDLGFEDMPKFGRENKKESKDKQPAFTGNMKDLNKFLEEQARKMAAEKESKRPPKSNSPEGDAKSS